MKRLLAALLVLAPSLAFAGGFSGDGFGSSGFFQFYLIPIPPVSTGLITPVLSIFTPPNTGTGAIFGGLAGTGPTSTTSTSTAFKIPMPVAGTIFGLTAATATTQNAGTAIAINLNGGTGNTGCIYATASPFNCAYGGTGDHIFAGTLAQWRVKLGSGSWNASSGPAQASFNFQADSGQSGPLFSAPTNLIGTPTTYESIGLPFQNTAEVLVSVVQPTPGQIAGIYCYPNASDNGANVHSCAVMQNGVATGVACTNDPANPTLGCCANVGGTGNIGGNPLAPCSSITAISVAIGDTLSNRVSCGGTCVNIAPGMSVIWQPTNSGEVPLYTITTNSPSTTVPWFSSAVDDNFSQTTAANWNISPNLATTMTFSKLLACTVSTVTTGTWKEQFQYTNGTNLTPPTTNSSLVASYSGPSGTTCPYSGVPARIMNSGFQDTTHTQAVSAGYTLGFNIIPTGPPSGALRWKTSMVVTVP